MKTAKIIGALLLSAAIALSSGCINTNLLSRPESPGGSSQQPQQTQQTQQSAGGNTPSVPEPDGEGVFGNGRSTMLSLDGDELSISRRTRFDEQSMGENGVWTIFVYLCGTDLESGQGSGTDDLNEMIDGVSSDKVRFIVETDGTSEWYNSTIEGRRKQRFIVDKHGIEEIYSGSSTNMGDASTLEEFLKWGVENYASERMGVIMWNHGGGSITGVCFDENYFYDSLLVLEMEKALTAVYDEMTCRFDFIGFDACLMSTVEIANMLVPHAKYMYASQELESGYGWDYSAIGEYLSSAGTSADGESLGKVVCDSFMESCEWSGEEDDTTLACIDLSLLDAALVEFNSYMNRLYDYCSSDVKLANIIRSINDVKAYGSNNSTEGYTNMLDMGGIIKETSETSGIDGSRALAALKDCVVYSVQGYNCRDGHGLSVYYPLSVEGSDEIATLMDICISPYYLSFVDLVAYSGYNAGSTENYDDSDWLDDDSSWFWGDNDDDEDYSSDYWDDWGSDGYNFDVDSSALDYLTEPHLSEDGMYQFTLTEDSMLYLDTVYCNILMSYFEDDGTELVLDLGTDDYVSIDWYTGDVEDNFSGYWFALPDGQPLAAFLIEATYDYNIYTAPIFLNDEFTYLRIRQDYYDDYYTTTMLGTWDGIDEYGSASREERELQVGDRIAPCYDAYDISTGEYVDYYYGDDWVYNGDPSMEEALLYEGEYYYGFEIYDIFGSTLYTDFVLFGVEANGDLYFYEDDYGTENNFFN